MISGSPQPSNWGLQRGSVLRGQALPPLDYNLFYDTTQRLLLKSGILDRGRTLELGAKRGKAKRLVNRIGNPLLAFKW